MSDAEYAQQVAKVKQGLANLESIIGRMEAIKAAPGWSLHRPICTHANSRPWGKRGFRECTDCGHIWDTDPAA